MRRWHALVAALAPSRPPPPPRQGLRDPLGPAGERVAARHIRAEGMRILERNARTRVGEVDLIALDPDKRTIVLVEVKARRIDAEDERRSPRPEAAVGERKRRKLLMLAESLARTRGWRDRPMRIDVVAVEWPERGRPRVRRFERAVTW